MNNDNIPRVRARHSSRIPVGMTANQRQRLEAHSQHLDASLSATIIYLAIQQLDAIERRAMPTQHRRVEL